MDAPMMNANVKADDVRNPGLTAGARLLTVPPSGPARRQASDQAVPGFPGFPGTRREGV
jgi:hypothetical protein